MKTMFFSSYFLLLLLRFVSIDGCTHKASGLYVKRPTCLVDTDVSSVDDPAHVGSWAPLPLLQPPRWRRFFHFFSGLVEGSGQYWLSRLASLKNLQMKLTLWVSSGCSLLRRELNCIPVCALHSLSFMSSRSVALIFRRCCFLVFFKFLHLGFWLQVQRSCKFAQRVYNF